MKFHVVNLGCKVNRVESDNIISSLIAHGHSFSPSSEAHCIIINTCTVTGEAEKKTRKAVRRALRENQEASVYVTGCAAAIDQAFFEEMDERVIVEPNKLLVISCIEERFSDDPLSLAEKVPSVEEGLPSEQEEKEGGQSPLRNPLRTGEGFPTRVGIKIQDGCNNACSYCIVHTARGRAWSRPASEVIEEVASYAEAGVKELVLTGINLGSYHDGETTLADLLQELLAEASALRFRISSIEPCDLDDALIQLIAASQGRICRHLHLPLQSGSSRVLAEMARPYNAAFFQDLVEKLYDLIPELSLSTDIIVGFPGETDEDFEETLRMATRCRFSKIHIFSYSKRKGTPAAIRGDQVDARVVADRVARLKTLADKLRQEAFEMRKGTQELVLVETEGFGTTESYFHVAVPSAACQGTLEPVTLSSFEER